MARSQDHLHYGALNYVYTYNSQFFLSLQLVLGPHICYFYILAVTIQTSQKHCELHDETHFSTLVPPQHPLQNHYSPSYLG